MLEELFKKVPIGSDITIMNCMYQSSRKDEETGTWSPDFIAIVYKDNTTGKKDHIIIEKPVYRFYILNENVPANYNRLFIEEDKLRMYEVPYKKLNKELADALGRSDEYKDNMLIEDRQARNRAMSEFHKDPRVFNSDQSIEDQYRMIFGRYYKNSVTKLYKSFFDIEVDSRYLVTSDFPTPEKAECPINAIAFLDERNNIVNSYLLRDDNNPLIAEFENDYISGKYGSKYIYDFVQDAVGGWKQMKRNKLDQLEFRLYFFDNEFELLVAFFSKIYEYDPDFIEGWNSSGFDIAYIIKRLYVLGADYEEYMSDPNWEIPFVKHYIDTKNLNEFAERGDYTKIACNTVWLDQMIQFCSRRKAKMGSFTSFKLDDIAQLTAKVRKYDYSDITNDLGELPYLNYRIFVLYNIIDVISAKCIENHTQDLEYIFAKCINNCTSYNKGHRQTVYLINRMRKEWYDLPDRFIFGNNVNKQNRKPEKFQGALVEDPLTVSDYAKLKTINGNTVMLSDNDVDFDFKSLYPSLILEYNTAPHTQIGRIDIWNTWKVKYHPPIGEDITRYINGEDIICYIKDPGVAKEFPWTEIDDKKVPKMVKLYQDKECTQFIYEVPYNEEYFETLSYEKYYKEENFYGNDKYSRGGDFIEDLVTDNPIILMHRWFSFANIREFLIDWNLYNQECLKTYSRHGNYGRFNYIPEECRVLESPLYDIGPKKEVPFYFPNNKEKPIFDFRPMKGLVNLDDYDKSRFNGRH